MTILLLWAAFTAAIAAAWCFLGFLAVTTSHLITQAAKRRHYRQLTDHAINQHPGGDPVTCRHCDGAIVYCKCCNRFIHVEGNTAYCRSLPDGTWIRAEPAFP